MRLFYVFAVATTAGFTLTLLALIFALVVKPVNPLVTYSASQNARSIGAIAITQEVQATAIAVASRPRATSWFTGYTEATVIETPGRDCNSSDAADALWAPTTSNPGEYTYPNAPSSTTPSQDRDTSPTLCVYLAFDSDQPQPDRVIILPDQGVIPIITDFTRLPGTTANRTVWTAWVTTNDGYSCYDPQYGQGQLGCPRIRMLGSPGSETWYYDFNSRYALVYY